MVQMTNLRNTNLEATGYLLVRVDDTPSHMVAVV